MQLFAEPTETRFDLRFKVRGIPVRVHPWFWIATFLLSLGKDFTLLSFAIWLPVVFASILVHELGHALAFIRFGARPRICMHGMGGLAIADEPHTRRDAGQAILIAAAGPLAGFALGGLVIAITAGLGYQVDVLGRTLIAGAPLPNLPLVLLVHQLLAINLVWGAVNLLPVHPLDGGQIFYHLFYEDDFHTGHERSLRLSLWISAFVALWGVAISGAFLAVLFGYLALNSWLALKQLGAPAWVTPRPMRWIKRRFRAAAHEVEQQRRTSDRKRVDAKLTEQLASQDLAEGANEDLKRTADELLARLNDEIRRDRKLQK